MYLFHAFSVSVFDDVTVKQLIECVICITSPVETTPSSFRQPHSVHCPPGSPHPVHITSSQSPPFTLIIYHVICLSFFFFIFFSGYVC